MAYLLAVVQVVNVIWDSRWGWSDSSGRRHSHTNSGYHQRDSEGKRCQSQTSDGRHPPYSRGGSSGDAGDLGFVVESVDVVGNGVQPEDGLPEELGSLREDFVEDTQAALNLVRQDGERPGVYSEAEAKLCLFVSVRKKAVKQM